MAGTATVTEYRSGFVKKIHFDWASDTTETVTQATTYPYDGRVIDVIFTPDAAATQPSDSYDVTLEDADGTDVLNALGANLSNAATVRKVQEDKTGAVANSILTLKVAAAGENKGGLVDVYIR